MWLDSQTHWSRLALQSSSLNTWPHSIDIQLDGEDIKHKIANEPVPENREWDGIIEVKRLISE